MHHSVLNTWFFLDVAAIDFDYKRVVIIDRAKSVKQSHKSANKILFTFGRNANPIGRYIYAVIVPVKRKRFCISNFKNEFFALADKEILSVGDTLANATVSSIKAVLDEKDCSVLTLFYGKDISDEYIEILSSDLSHMCKGTEIATVATHDKTCDLTITFE